MKRTEMIFQKSISDAERMQKIAKYCIFITPKGGVRIQENDNFILEIVVVIGPYHSEEIDLDEAVLLEVGLYRCKPYIKAEGKTDRSQGRSSNPKRYGHYCLTPEQYRLVAPYLFSYLYNYATEKILFWKNDWHNPRWIKVPVSPHLDISGEIRDYKWCTYDPEVRFKIDERDELFLADIYWAELFGFDNLQTKLDLLVKAINSRLSGYKIKNRRTLPKSWMQYPKFRKAIFILKRLPYYQQVYVWKTYFRGHAFEREIVEQIGYQGVSPWEEQIRNKALPNQDQRIAPPVKIRVQEKKNLIITVRLYPPAPGVPNSDELEKLM